MSDIRVEQSQDSRTQRGDALEFKRRTVELHSSNAYETQRATFAGIGKLDLSAITQSNDDESIDIRTKEIAAEETQILRLRNGQYIESPSLLSEEARTRVAEIYDNLSPQQGQDLRAATGRLGNATLNHFGAINGPEATSAAMRSAASDTYHVYQATQGEAGREAQLYDSVALGMSGIEGELVDFFDKLREQNAIEQEVRTDVAELHDLIENWPDDGSQEVIDYREVVIDEHENATIVEHKGVALNKEEAIDLWKNSTETSTDSAKSKDTNHVATKMTNNYDEAVSTSPT
ncbi:MAG: hypothetical protein R3C68_01935 [Myxococcota bacterium]